MKSLLFIDYDNINISFTRRVKTTKPSYFEHERTLFRSNDILFIDGTVIPLFDKNHWLSVVVLIELFN